MSRAKYYDEINISQAPALEVLQKLGYVYMTTEEAERQREHLYKVLLKDVLVQKLSELNAYEYGGKEHSFSRSNIEQAVKDLDEELTDGLIKTNEKIYDSLILGRSYQETLTDGNRRSFNINYIDWEHPENNAFHVVEEFSVEREDGNGTARPDIVLFINGIPLAVIECKRASVSIEQGISQMIRNQGKDYIPQLFKFIQVVMAANKNEAKYATCGTPKEFWSVWKEEEREWLDEKLAEAVVGRLPTIQDENIISMLSPGRLMELIKYFTLFDKDVKKIARYQQYFAIREILRAIDTEDEYGNRQSGVIWHTQGSGKSLTMVMLARQILSDFSACNPKVVVVTDRIELDKQIHATFNHTRLKADRAISGRSLVGLIKDGKADVVTTLVHKFDIASEQAEPVTSKDIFILVDESHRTQYGELNLKMRKVFPNACYLGFTGTPLMKNEKSTMIKFGGKLLHKYTIADAVADKAIVPLLYEGKMVEQNVNRDAIDNRLKMITKNLNDKQKAEVMQKWSRFERIASSEQRIAMIAFDINEHFLNNYKTKSANAKAMLATNSKIEAVKYLEAFKELGDLNCAVVISSPDMREGFDEVDKASKDEVRRFWDEMMKKYGSEDSYEDTIKDEFVNGDDIDILIVVDKLLTGFDAPRATVLYVDKPMKEHTLLQAIARVNRLYEGKDYGLIVDYRGLLEKLDEAMEIYSGAGLENFDSQDIKGALNDVISTLGDLRHYYSELKTIFSSVQNKSDTEEYEVLLAEEELREQFYETLCHFGRNLGIALGSEKIYNALPEDELAKYKSALKFYQELRRSVKLRYSDGIDHKEYEAKMQRLMDTYISAVDIVRITKPVDILDKQGFEEELTRLGSSRARADAIRTRLTASIKTKWDENPAFYKRFSDMILETLKEYEEHRISEAEYLNRMNDIVKEYREGPASDNYPASIRSSQHAQAFYGVAKEVLEGLGASDDDMASFAVEAERAIKENVRVDWHDSTEVHRKIEQELDDLICDFYARCGMELDFDKVDMLMNKVMTVAMRRF